MANIGKAITNPKFATTKSNKMSKYFGSKGAKRHVSDAGSITSCTLSYGTAIAFVVLLTGCVATRTSPQTVPLASIQSKLTTPAVPIPTESLFAVGIRYPAGFQSEEAKLLLVQKVNAMMTRLDKKGRPNPKPKFSWQYFPEETAYKSLAASLQLREVLLSNHNFHAFLVPCNLVATNGELVLQPTRPAVPQQAMVDISILNLLMNYQGGAPWFKYQGCSMSRYFAPMVAVSMPSRGGNTVVAGTRRWMTKDNQLAVVLPEVLERSYTDITYGLFMNYSIVKPNQSGFLPLNISRPANASSYYELDSFVEREKTDKDFGAYWSFVEEIVAEVVKGASADPSEMAKAYAKSLGVAELPEAKVALARKFMIAEWKFLVEADNAKVGALRKGNWFAAVEAVSQSEDKLLESAKSRYFWNQFGQLTVAFAGAAAVGAGSASAMHSGTYYNSAPTTMTMMSAVQALGEAGSKEQLEVLSSYKSVVEKTETSINSVSLGLGEEATGSTIKSIDDIRRLARKYLGGAVPAS